MSSEDRKAPRREYAGLYEEVEAILFRHDPAGINFGENTDEYDPEVSTILHQGRSRHLSGRGPEDRPGGV
jgi:hypothetical protein